MTQRGAPDEFYLNDGHGHFTKVPFTGGRFLDPQGKPITEAAESFTLDAKFVDLNGDGAPDLYVGNDFEDLDELWWNDGHGHFKRADWTAQRQIEQLGDGRRRRRHQRRRAARLVRSRHAEQRHAPAAHADPDAHGVAQEAGRHRDRAPAAAQHALSQSRRRHVRRGRHVRRRAGERLVVGHAVHGRRPRRPAGHPRRQRPSLGHHGRRRSGGAPESPVELSVAATALAVSAAAAQERRVPQSRRPDVRGREREVEFRH